ncbi:MAG: iron-containing alcohol dehydrogenase family protein [Bryobacteraceae bacterium]|nr:iron-containing alcohol dehydrogenase family protein [Bryobacteraceae bacterium]
MRKQHIQVPELVRMKSGALDRVGLYLQRPGFRRAALFVSEGLHAPILEAARRSLAQHDIDLRQEVEVRQASVENAVALLGGLARGTQAVVGLGGGKALDVGKYVSSLAGLPYFAVPTSLSNDGFCSPQSSLTLEGKRKSLPTGLPHGVVVDTDVCLRAPVKLWHSGVGDLTAKLTAVFDWKLAFHANGTPVNDLAALLSDATVYQFMASPTRDANGIRLLATALMLNGVAMEIAGSSRPASGSEHLISHALDTSGARPVMHGLQTGTAAYLVSRLQDNQHERIAGLFETTGFWESVRQSPFSRAEWKAAVAAAPGIKDDFHTVLSTRDCWPEIEAMIDGDPALRGCFEA